MKGFDDMNPIKILKGTCTVVGAATLGAAALLVAVYAFTTLELPRTER